jgi:MoaA/NifB/PqqE/SkfB family radical SAM enzyme
MDDINKLRKEIIESKTFCFYPFLELSTNPAGHLKPCCYQFQPMYHSWGDGPVISIANGDTFDTAWNSKFMQTLRQDLTEGRIPQSCDLCIRDGDASMRKRSVNEYKNDINALTLVDNTIKSHYMARHTPVILELKPSNLCNIKCVMCNSYDSSQVAKELTELSTKFKGIEIKDGRFMSKSTTPGITENNKLWKNVSEVGWDDNEAVWKNFEKIAPNLEILSFAGGEPTLMPFVLKTLDYCVEKDYAKNITVFISSNFTNLNKKFFELMPKYKKFELIASIDGYDKVNNYSRFPSKWSQISKNYIAAKEYMKYPNVKILTNITVSILTIMDLVDLLYWLEDRANEYPYFKEWPYNINLVMYPEEQRINLLPDNLKAIAIYKLTKYLSDSQILKEFPGLDSKIHLLINELKTPDDPGLFNIFKERIHVLDDHREINIADYIPSISNLFYPNGDKK